MKFSTMKSLTLLIVALFLSGCSTVGQTKPLKAVTGLEQQSQDNQQMFERLDRMVQRAQVTDGSLNKVRGFPYLRADRFVISLKDRIETPRQKQRWVHWMLELDQQARAKEIMNLLPDDFEQITAELGLPQDRQEVIRIIQKAAQARMHQDQVLSESFSDLKKAVRAPSDYSIVMRTLGVYPLFAIPTIYQTNKLYAEFQEWHHTPLDELAVRGKVENYYPENQLDYSASAVEGILQLAERDAFGLPLLSKNSLRELVRYFAPVIRQDITADYDRFGAVTMQNGNAVINTDRPVVYYYTSFNYVNQQQVLQLNYAFWYPGRYGPYAPWLEHGPLDGLTLRVSLNLDTGEPVMADATNNCGCYYFFIPRKDTIASVVDFRIEPDPFVPTWLPEEYPQQPINLRINAGWHQIQKVYADAGTWPTATYELLPYDQLESMADYSGQYQSAFDPLGLLKGTSRIEKYLLFSSGIHSIGYMRQRGRQPIKIIGRMHFTDPDIYDKHFIYK